jgi:hypothetical protein
VTLISQKGLLAVTRTFLVFGLNFLMNLFFQKEEKQEHDSGSGQNIQNTIVNFKNNKIDPKKSNISETKILEGDRFISMALVEG